jgi:signal transduction histidine kinase
MKAIIKIGLLFLLISTGVFNSNAQRPNLDSLRGILQRKMPDSSRAEVLTLISRSYRRTLPDSAIYYGELAMRLAKHLTARHIARIHSSIGLAHHSKGDMLIAKTHIRKAILKSLEGNGTPYLIEQAEAHNEMAIVIDSQGDYDSALYYYNQALMLYSKLGDNEMVNGIRYNIGTCYWFMGNFPLALRTYLECLPKVKRLDTRAMVLHAIGQVYVDLGEPAKAKQNLLESISLYETDQHEKPGQADAMAALGSLYSAQNQPDSAILFLNRSLKMNNEVKNRFGVAENHLYFGIHYKNSNDWSQVVKEADKAAEMHEELGTKHSLADSYLLAAEGYFKLHQIEKAIGIALKGLELSKEIKAQRQERDFVQLLTQMYGALKNFPLAYSYSQQLVALKDSINSSEKIKQIANMEALYENDKKEKELAVVRAEKLTADAQLSEQQTRATLLIVGLSLVSIVLLAGIFFYIALQRNRKTLALKNAELLKLNQTKDRFFAIVGHDLRGPITSFSGINDLLNWYISKNDIEQLKSFGGKITQSVRQLDTLLNNLLNWAMSQTDAVPYKPEPLQLNQLTKECYGYFQHSLEVKQISLIDETSDDLFVYADKNALATVLRNLVSNAIKFTPAKGTIKISAKAEGNFVWIEVRDSGVGLSVEKLKTIFTLSDSKSTSGTQGEKGTGLGLVLCADYVALNKGKIKVESKEGEGTVFRFSVPAFEPEELTQLKKGELQA